MRRDEDVGRLEIPVKDPFAVRRGERVRQRQAIVYERVDVHGPAQQAVMQRLAVEQLHHQERDRRGTDVVIEQMRG